MLKFLGSQTIALSTGELVLLLRNSFPELLIQLVTQRALVQLGPAGSLAAALAA